MPKCVIALDIYSLINFQGSGDESTWREVTDGEVLAQYYFVHNHTFKVSVIFFHEFAPLIDDSEKH